MEEKKKSGFNKKFLIWAVVILMLWVIGQTALDSAKEKAAVSKIEKQQQPQVGEVVISPVFDVPALIGKSIDEVAQTLGESKKFNNIGDEPTDLQLELGTTEWDRTWEKDGYELLVTYNVETRQIKDFFIPLKSGGSASDINKLLPVGNLQRGAANYTIKSVEAINEANVFTGIIVTPKS